MTFEARQTPFEKMEILSIKPQIFSQKWHKISNLSKPLLRATTRLFRDTKGLLRATTSVFRDTTSGFRAVYMILYLYMIMILNMNLIMNLNKQQRLRAYFFTISIQIAINNINDNSRQVVIIGSIRLQDFTTDRNQPVVQPFIF